VNNNTLVDVHALRKEFRRRGGATGLLGRTPAQPVIAVRDVSLTLREGETLGIVGESGSGKSTLGRMILGLIEPTSGTISFAGRDITHRSARERRELARDIQVIFQDPYGSLNPRHRVEDIIREPLDIHKIGTPDDRRERVHHLMDRVALAARYRRSYPHELSGGLRQRVGIATALAVNPRVIIADEPVSALDVSVQAQIMDLLGDIQRETSVGMFFISHDLGVVREISDRVAVMRHGQIVEHGDIDTVYRSPQHAYTEALLSAILPVDPDAPFNPILLDDDLVTPG
jgi:ABC-type glutathione transport system ATPase component